MYQIAQQKLPTINFQDEGDFHSEHASKLLTMIMSLITIVLSLKRVAAVYAVGTEVVAAKVIVADVVVAVAAFVAFSHYCVVVVDAAAVVVAVV